MQGLGKTVTTIALLVSNHVEPEREWGRVKVELDAPKRKRLKWEPQNPATNGASTSGVKESEAEPNTVDRSGTGSTKELQHCMGFESEAAQPEAEAGPKVCLCGRILVYGYTLFTPE